MDRDSIIAIFVSVAAFIVAYFTGRRFKEHNKMWFQVLNIFDSAGLAAFTVAGVNAAHICGFAENSFLSIFVGTLTAVGGGVLRDVMAGRVPVILKKQVYALAAIAGASVYQCLFELSDLSNTVIIAVSISSVIVIRILATVFHWNLPSLKNAD